MKAVLRILAIGLVAAGLGGSASGAIAQEETARSNFTPVSGTATSFSTDDSGAMGWHDSGNWYVSETDTHITVEWSDPRLPAEVNGLMSVGAFDSDAGQPGRVVLGQWLLEGSDGYWNGPMRLYYDEQATGHGMSRLTGHGEYENLTALLMTTSDTGCIECLEFTGAIFEGAMPTMMEPLEPVAE